MVEVKIKRMHDDAVMPAYATAGSAGLDLVTVDGGYLESGIPRKFRTGLSVEIPAGYEAQIRPRSGLASKHAVTVVNTPGTIDSDFRGEVVVSLVCLSPAGYQVQKGDRIAQMVIAPVVQAKLVEADELSETSRGDGGFGSTGR